MFAMFRTKIFRFLRCYHLYENELISAKLYSGPLFVFEKLFFQISK